MKAHSKDETGDRGRKSGRGGSSGTACSWLKSRRSV